MTSKIDNTMNVIDSRDLEERFEELDCIVNEEDMGTSEEQEELESLRVLVKEGDLYIPDWFSGTPLIRDSHFTEYVKECAEDADAVPPDMPWPLNHIDWEAAAEELKAEYADFDFDGVTYWVYNM